MNACFYEFQLLNAVLCYVAQIYICILWRL
ncbi:hypothetical protein OIU76_025637 [Salix suchowensis]|nr:hypothetical protein OIU76_025637 [Salix suchowensis]